MADVYELYERRLHASNAMDFDDLLVRTVDLFERFPDVRERWASAFATCSSTSTRTRTTRSTGSCACSRDDHRNVCVVGDADQSIYAWRGADIRNILDFETDFPDASIVRLEQNYRSTQTILDAANAVIEHNANRLGEAPLERPRAGRAGTHLEVEDEHAEARLVATRIGELMETGTAASEIAVFYRTNAQSRVLEDLLCATTCPTR